MLPIITIMKNSQKHSVRLNQVKLFCHPTSPRLDHYFIPNASLLSTKSVTSKSKWQSSVTALQVHFKTHLDVTCNRFVQLKCSILRCFKSCTHISAKTQNFPFIIMDQPIVLPLMLTWITKPTTFSNGFKGMKSIIILKNMFIEHIQIFYYIWQYMITCDPPML